MANAAVDWRKRLAGHLHLCRGPQGCSCQVVDLQAMSVSVVALPKAFDFELSKTSSRSCVL